MIRRRFISDINRRVKKLLKALKKFLVEDDAFGLAERKQNLAFLQEREFQFLTDAEKLKTFNEWFRQQVDANILSPLPGVDPFTVEYVESAYKRGQLNAYLSSKEARLLGELGVGDQTAEQFLRTAFLQPETLSKVQLLGTRSFEQLKGVTAQMGADMNRILAQGIADGTNPREIGRTMSTRVESLTRQRATTIARTEVIHAHAEGQLDAFDKLGVDELGVKAEWSTAGDNRVCPFCAAREGEVFTVGEARNLIPLHPNCRCTWIPAIPEGLTK